MAKEILYDWDAREKLKKGVDVHRGMLMHCQMQ